MSASIVTVFLPVGGSYDSLMQSIVDELHLKRDELPSDFPFGFTAQRIGEDHLLVQYDADSTDITREMEQWEKPSQDFKLLLQGCGSSINIHYRNIDLAKQCIIKIGIYLGRLSSRSVFENGNGCLLRLSDIIEHCLRDPDWSWERETFADIPGVADSEWIG